MLAHEGNLGWRVRPSNDIVSCLKFLKIPPSLIKKPKIGICPGLTELASQIHQNLCKKEWHCLKSFVYFSDRFRIFKGSYLSCQTHRPNTILTEKHSFSLRPLLDPHSPFETELCGWRATTSPILSPPSPAALHFEENLSRPPQLNSTLEPWKYSTEIVRNFK